MHWQQFRAITLPLMRRTLLFSAVIAIINAVQVFEPVALITQGGPVGSTNVLTYHIRRVGIERAEGGLGSAMAVTLMLALIVVICAGVRAGQSRGRRRERAGLSRHLGVAAAAGGRSAGRALLASLMLLVTVASAFPLVWMVLTSLKTTAETMQVPPVWIPRSPNLDAYEKVAGVVNVGRSMWNSLVIASITTAGILLTSMMAGYAFAKYRFRGRNAAVLGADRDHVPAADRHADPALPDGRLARPRAPALPASSCPTSPTPSASS